MLKVSGVTLGNLGPCQRWTVRLLGQFLLESEPPFQGTSSQVLLIKAEFQISALPQVAGSGLSWYTGAAVQCSDSEHHYQWGSDETASSRPPTYPAPEERQGCLFLLAVRLLSF